MPVAWRGTGDQDLAKWLGAALLPWRHQRGGWLSGDRSHARHVQEEGGLSRHGYFIQFAISCPQVLFIFGLKQLGFTGTARRGNMFSALGMLVAIVAALLDQGIVDFQYIVIGFVVGGASVAQQLRVWFK